MTTASTDIPIAEIRRIRSAVDVHGAPVVASCAHVHLDVVLRACGGQPVKGVSLGALLAACERLNATGTKPDNTINPGSPTAA